MHPKPQLIDVALSTIHPTQVTVGQIEVALKRKQWQSLAKKARVAALASHWFPVIHGPEGVFYVVDRHHFGLALLQEGVSSVSVMVLKDLSALPMASFWCVMDHNQWVHPYDSEGVRRDFSIVPQHLAQLRDDPYRSLAGELRRAGGYAKDVAPYSEFLWADFLRDKVSAVLIGRDFDKALAKAQKLARGAAASYLPGWCGVVAPF